MGGDDRVFISFIFLVVRDYEKTHLHMMVYWSDTFPMILILCLFEVFFIFYHGKSQIHHLLGNSIEGIW